MSTSNLIIHSNIYITLYYSLHLNLYIQIEENLNKRSINSLAGNLPKIPYAHSISLKFLTSSYKSFFNSIFL